VRLLVGTGQGFEEVMVDEERLLELYAYPEPLPDQGYVRANMVSSLDGAAAGADGRSGSISSRADRRVFSVLRGLSDVVLVGAGTVRTEGYSRPRARPAFRRSRTNAGQSPSACLAVVTASGELPTDTDLWTTPGLVDGHWQLVVLTCEGAAPERISALRHQLGEDAVVVAGGERVDPALALDALAARGLRRVLCEGGPSLLAQVAAAGRLDELCLTTSPQLSGGDASRVVHGPPLDAPPMLLRHLLEADGTLLARWVR